MQTLNIRNVPEWANSEFAINAGGRGWKHHEYLAALIVLHRVAKEEARKNAQFGAMLDSLGLTEIVV